VDALYFPYLSLPASTWVNPALLYFDRLGIIAPDFAGRALFDDRTRELIELRMVRPMTPRGAAGNEDRDFISYMRGRCSERPAFRRVERVHAGKLAYTPIADALIQGGLLARVDGEWLEGPDWVVGHVMAHLAMKIFSRAPHPLSLVTDDRAATKVMVGTQEGKKMSRRVRAIARLLPVPGDVRPEEIARFRQAHCDELQAFRSYVDQLIARDPASDDGDDEFETRLRDAQRVRDYLTGEMRAFNWRVQGPAFAIAAVGAAAPFIEQSPWSFGSGLLALAYAGAQGAAALRQRREGEQSPLFYATQVAGNWAPSARQTLL
jgi:hypothetical protein